MKIGFLGIEKAAWSGIEESAGSSLVKHHVGDSLSLLAEDNGENAAERSDQQLALSKAIENMILSIEKNSIASKSNKEKHQEYENECREKLAMDDAQLSSEAEAIEIIVACSVMALEKERELKEEESQSPKSKWAKWKRGGIIGAAAVTGGAVLAITGGLAAPAIAAGLGALAPTLGTLIPVIGATGFAAVAVFD
ncbi:hypothetical protein SAY86_018504 [Trapa natans]|uniref:Uncharacterized protein n=1 Tax=Trapa natans TaxID=22666 RepID=A0AAN7LDD2_TRANT|nr:hypothetical protein SAY86_018504 [Trapa natans]